MRKSTKEQLLEVAHRQFAQRGFYGTSIASIAEELKLTKQALLHHFGSKEKLYGEVLQRLSDRLLETITQIKSELADPKAQLETLVKTNFQGQFEQLEDIQIVMRELLDNQTRAEQAHQWYLRPFLDALSELVMEIPQHPPLTEAEALAFVLQLLGSVNYFAIAEPTLNQMYGRKHFVEIKENFPDQLIHMVRSRFSNS